ncbi:hypothetical protein TBLA_0E04370 [Henningerozyma blattae CBS 6284]|uniref:Transmembrane 9 superfamily member n=1 Tax=Henningerozyma blattae (strain ATCC 34711 / CBS 6284 / DSM 70876 / NBRC 10599 / NRRL Y-10934 / UCD 77-7) TaxID=1071380 RepID=I2H539_HENB6|nr:hypothetical protein TBLA_0E04370 [Tetrapisispora blattae CBS 6284]CCH61491.1 hypothetical protein TBLA_0E04370 [Tetrapisispora blattae CBS 6284]
MTKLITAVSICLITLSVTNGFYLPGVAPTTYHELDSIPLLVNHLTPSMFFKHKDSDGNELSSDKENFLYSYDYYYSKLHFCKPLDREIKKQPESLGSILFGDRIYNSPFELKMLVDENCKELCSTNIPGDDAKFINDLIKSGFLQNWLIDGLPAARQLYDQTTKSSFYGSGFELGSVEMIQVVDEAPSHTTPKQPIVEDVLSQELDEEQATEKRANQMLVSSVERTYFANHFDIHIEYHDRGNNEYRIVGVTVNPISMKRDSAICDTNLGKLALSEVSDTDVIFTYSVTFEKSDTVWATRWDKYLHIYDPTIQWFSLINFTVIVVVLSIIVVHFLTKALKNDFVRYNEFNLNDSFDEDSGWKLAHGDVFRIPTKSMLLSIFVGSGTQLFFMISSVLVLAALGFLSPSARGSLPTIMFILYAVFGFVGSYTSMGVYRFFNGPYWKANMILTPLIVPGGIFMFIISMNLFLVFVHSSDVVPIGTLSLMVLLWIVLSLPLSFAGSLISFKRCTWYDHPTKTNEVLRQIPFQPWYLKTVPATLIGGIFPFGSIAVELYFIYSSLWFNKIFYMFGFLLVSFLLLTMTTSLVTIIVTYHSLCLENWRWQWRSFIIGGIGCSIYIFIHSILFTEFKLGGFITIVLYVGYSALIAILCAMVTGAIGFISNMFFVKKIYSSIKVE